MYYFINLPLKKFEEFNSLNLNFVDFNELFLQVIEINYCEFYNFLLVNKKITQELELVVKVAIDISEESSILLTNFSSKLFLSKDELIISLIIFCINNKFILN